MTDGSNDALPWRAIAVAIALLVTYNIARSTALPSGAHFAANVAFAALMLGAGVVFGMTISDLGLATDRVPSGLRYGFGAVAIVATTLLVAAAVPTTRGFFDDDRAEVSLASMLLRVIIVIPIGTVVVEEITFRGVLDGLLRRRYTPLAATLGGAALFGLWHVVPAWRGYDVADGGTGGRVALVVGTFVATFVAGLVFLWLRHRSDSLVAPMLAHTATNSIPFAIAWFMA